MKKIICFLLAFTMLFAFSSCGNQTELEKEIAELKSVVESLKEDNSKLSNQVGNLEKTYEDSLKANEELNSQIKQKEELISKYEKDYENYEKTLLTLLNKNTVVDACSDFRIEITVDKVIVKKDDTITVNMKVTNFSEEDLTVEICDWAIDKKDKTDLLNILIVSLGQDVGHTYIEVFPDYYVEWKTGETIEITNEFTLTESGFFDVATRFAFFYREEDGKGEGIEYYPKRITILVKE